MEEINIWMNAAWEFIFTLENDIVNDCDNLDNV